MGKVIGGTLLIAGTTVGAGMLALPLATGLLGFFPTLVVFAAIWALMLWSAFLIVEINVAIPGNVNLISMAKATLGKQGAMLMWLVFLLLFYALLSAYFAGSGPFFSEVIDAFWGIEPPSFVQPFFLLIILAPFVFMGIQAVDVANRYLMIGKITAYVALVGYVLSKISPALLLHVDLRFAIGSFAVVLTAFGYHVLIPSLMQYLDRDVRKVHMCIVAGSLLSLISYVVWEMAILGTLPANGENSIAQLITQGHSVAQALQANRGVAGISHLARAFALLAIGTSFLGVSAGLSDFLRDGLKFSTQWTGKTKSLILTYLPPIMFAVLWPQGFVVALQYAGLLVGILLGIFPICMVVKVRGKWQPSTLGGLLAFIALMLVALAQQWLGF